MKFCHLILLIFISFQSVGVFAFYDTIYGKDDRVLYEEAVNKKYKLFGLSTAARIHKAFTKPEGETPTAFKVWAFELKDSLFEPVCEDVRYAKIISAATCTGFLISADILITAKHCVPNETVCKNIRWVFDFQKANISRTADSEIEISKKSSYDCLKIIDSSPIEQKDADWAIVKLSRKTANRPFLKLSKKRTIDPNAKLVVVGYPQGLPLIITPNGVVTDNTNKHYFKTNNDIFSGNSGSPIINQSTNEVEGIVIAGDEDYIFNPARGCLELKQCKEGNLCSGEKSQRIQNIIDFLPKA